MFFKYIKSLYSSMQKIPADNIKSDPLDKRRLFEFYLMRPLAFLPTIVFYRIKVSPDTVTWMGFIIQVLAAAGYIFAPIEYSIILAVIFNVSFIFDHIDGNLARLYKTTNQWGKYLDGCTGEIGKRLVVSSIGIFSFKSTGEISGIVLALSILLIGPTYQYLLFRYKVDLSNEYGSYNKERIGKPEIDKVHSSKNLNRILVLYKNNSSIIIYPSLIMFSLIEKIDLYLYSVLIYSLVLYVPLIVKVFYQAKRNLGFYRPT